MWSYKFFFRDMLQYYFDKFICILQSRNYKHIRKYELIMKNGFGIDLIIKTQNSLCKKEKEVCNI